MIHALAILYVRWRMPSPQKTDGTLAAIERGLSVNVQNDLDWLEAELNANNANAKGGRFLFLVGDSLTAADIMMMFSVQFIFARRLGAEMGTEMEIETESEMEKKEKKEKKKRWETVERWLRGLEGCESYLRAVEKSGYKL